MMPRAEPIFFPMMLMERPLLVPLFSVFIYSLHGLVELVICFGELYFYSLLLLSGETVGVVFLERLVAVALLGYRISLACLGEVVDWVATHRLFNSHPGLAGRGLAGKPSLRIKSSSTKQFYCARK